MLKEFREFAVKGNMIDLAVGVIMGGAFGAVVNSLVKDVLMPPIGALLGGADFSNMMWIIKEGSTAGPYATPAAAADAGATVLSYGVFVNTVINFVIVAVAVFMLVKTINRLRRQQEEPAATKACPYCRTDVALEATRCPACTSTLET